MAILDFEISNHEFGIEIAEIRDRENGIGRCKTGIAQTFLSVSGGTPDYSYKLYKNNTFKFLQSSDYFDNLSSGSYDLANTSSKQQNSAKQNFTGGFGFTYNNGNDSLDIKIKKNINIF